MIDYTSFLHDLRDNGINRDFFLENTECAYRFLMETDAVYAKAIKDAAAHMNALFDYLTLEQINILENQYYYITDYFSLQDRFYYAIGQILALLELIAPQEAPALLDTIDEKHQAFLRAPAAEQYRKTAEESYKALSAIFSPIGCQQQLNHALDIAQKPHHRFARFLPFAGYANQRLEWSQGDIWDPTPLSAALLAYYENSK